MKKENIISENHPGFSDAEYRNRRNQIASIAINFSNSKDRRIPNVHYAKEEHAVWKSVYSDLASLYPQHACKEYNECFNRFGLYNEQIPQFSALNRRLLDYNFEVIPVTGLVAPREFLSELAHGRMMCTQYIRHHSVPEYTPEPDVIHEVFGHVIFFLNNRIREINAMFGRAATYASDDSIEGLIRLYWHTVEFGVCKEGDDTKAYGAGLLSSINELSSMEEIELRPFNIDIMKKTAFDTTNLQPFLFCAESFKEMHEKLIKHLAHYT